MELPAFRGHYSERKKESSYAQVKGDVPGAFGLLLETHASLAQWIAEQVNAKRVSLDRICTGVGRLSSNLKTRKCLDAFLW